MKYPKNVIEVQFNLLGSHDTPRIFTLCNNNPKKVKLLFVLLLSHPGTPCIYYGDEIGMTGGGDPECRKCMVWEKDQQNYDILHTIQTLIQLRKKYTAFGQNGDLIFLPTNDEDLLLFMKKNQKETILFVINRGEQSKIYDLPEQNKTWTNLFSKKQNPPRKALKLDAYSFHIWYAPSF